MQDFSGFLFGKIAFCADESVAEMGAAFGKYDRTNHSIAIKWMVDALAVDIQQSGPVAKECALQAGGDFAFDVVNPVVGFVGLRFVAALPVCAIV